MLVFCFKGNGGTLHETIRHQRSASPDLSARQKT